MILTETATATTIDTPAPASFTCAECPFARLIEDNRYCCTVSDTASDVTRGHWEATVSCFEALAAAEAQTVADETEAPIAPVTTPAPAALPAITPTAPAPVTAGPDDEPPNRGDNGRGRVQPAKPYDRTIAQLAIIREELGAIGIKLGKLIKSREDVKGWRLDWHGEKAGLYWTIGNGWEIASLKYETELTGNWEGFDLMEHLDNNGIELSE